jgi:hypothetical protein
MPYGLEVKDLANLALATIVAVMLGYFFLSKGRKRKQIAYTTLEQDVIPRSRDAVPGLEISYKRRPVKLLSRVTLWLWNAGNEPITGADLKTKLPLRLELGEKVTVLEIGVTTQTRETNNLTVGEDLLVTFDYLNPNDGAMIDIFVDKGEYHERADRPLVIMQGEIIGAAQRPSFSVFDSSMSHATRYLTAGLALMAFFWACSEVGGWHTQFVSHGRLWDGAAFAALSIVIAGAAIMLAGCLHRISATPVIPLSIRDGGSARFGGFGLRGGTD